VGNAPVRRRTLFRVLGLSSVVILGAVYILGKCSLLYSRADRAHRPTIQPPVRAMTQQASRIQGLGDKCVHTEADPWLTVDSRGQVCSHEELDPRSGCCHAPSNSQPCSGCEGRNRCCDRLEFCISCCMTETEGGFLPRLPKEKLRRYRLETLGAFDSCTVRCRSDSASVVHENAYVSRYHHCFGESLTRARDYPDRDIFSFMS